MGIFLPIDYIRIYKYKEKKNTYGVLKGEDGWQKSLLKKKQNNFREKK